MLFFLNPCAGETTDTWHLSPDCSSCCGAAAAEKMLEFAKVMLKNETHRELWDTMQVDLEAIKALEGAKPSLLKLVEDVQKLLPTQQS